MEMLMKISPTVRGVDMSFFIFFVAGI